MPQINAETVVDCQSVTRTYRRGTKGSRWLGSNNKSQPEITALDNISLQINPGEIVGIQGPSGSGKSTLLHLLGALDTPTSGTISISGQSIDSLSRRERTRLRLNEIGIVFQRFYLLSALPAVSNVALPLVEQGLSKAKRRERASTVLERVGLNDRQFHTPGQLSGGEQQRVAIARALVTEPDLLIADEPTGELDTGTGSQILELFKTAAADGTAVVLASHDEPTLAIADRVHQLRDGKRIDA